MQKYSYLLRWYVTIKDLKYLKNDTVNPFYFIINEVNGYFNEINKNKNLALVPTNEIKEIIKDMKNVEWNHRFN